MLVKHVIMIATKTRYAVVDFTVIDRAAVGLIPVVIIQIRS